MGEKRGPTTIVGEKQISRKEKKEKKLKSLRIMRQK